MAQTVSIQRGAVSGTANGGWITLFTHSTGIARIIPVNFEQWFSQGPNNNSAYFQLAVSSSTGGGQILSSINGTGSYNLMSFQVTCTNTNAQDIVGIYTTAAQKSINWSTGTTASPFNSGISSPQANYGNSSGSGKPNPIGQFFMGSGDTVRYRVTGIYNAGKGTSTCTTNANYSFVVITET